MVKRNEKWLFLIVIIVAVLVICFTYYYNVYYMKNKVVICYNLIIPDYEPKNIVIKDNEHIKLFKEMLSSSQEQYREANKQMSVAEAIYGSFISFETFSKDNKTVYVLRGTDLYVSVYKNYSASTTLISEYIVYKTSEGYYDKWVQYCENHIKQ